jgi:hypothetical protein
MENRIKKLIYEILFVDEIVEIFEEPDEWKRMSDTVDKEKTKWVKHKLYINKK